MHKRILALGLLVLTNATGAGNDDFGTKAVEANDMRQAGKLIGCEFDFWQTLQDPFMSPVRMVVIKGSFTIAAPDEPTKALWVLQISPNDATVVAGKLAFERFTPILAYFVTEQGFSSAGRQIRANPCSTGGICVAGQAGLQDLFVGIILSRSIKAAYQRSADSLDTDFTISLPQIGTSDHRYIQQFGECVGSLLRLNSR